VNRKRLVLVAAVAVVLSAALTTAIRVGAHDDRDRFDNGQLSFEYPSEWKRATWPVQSSFEKLVTYLSTEPLSHPCQGTSDAVSCGEPLRRLRAGGVLVEWSRVGFPETDRQRLNAMPGVWMSVAGRRAKLAVDRLPVCRGISADRSIFALVPLSSRGNYYAMRACLRAPGLNRAEQDVRRLLASTGIKEPTISR
jgi:hypothetical protein